VYQNSKFIFNSKFDWTH